MKSKSQCLYGYPQNKGFHKSFKKDPVIKIISIIFINSFFLPLIMIHACIKYYSIKKINLKIYSKTLIFLPGQLFMRQRSPSLLFQINSVRQFTHPFWKTLQLQNKFYISISVDFLWCGSNRRRVSIYYIDLPEISANHICHKV